MHRATECLLAILLGTAMGAAVPVNALSHEGHSPSAQARSADGDRSGDAPEQTWERDPLGFSARERVAIRTAYGDRRSDAATLAGRNRALVPGTRSPLKRNSLLPPRLRNRIDALPGAIERRLHPLDTGYARGTIGQDAAIVEERGHGVIDVIRDGKGAADLAAPGPR